MHQVATTNNEQRYSLSILIHQDGLSFYIHTSTGIESTIVRNFKYPSNPIEILDAIEDCYVTEQDLQSDFKTIKLIYHHSIYSIVPERIFNENHAADYLKYNTRLLQTDVVSMDDPLDRLETRTVYIAYSNINNFFFDKYGDYEYFHYTTLSLPHILDQGDGIFLEVKSSNFYLTYLKNGELLAHNIFPKEQVEDILYYTLFAIEQYKIDPETVQLQLIEEHKNKDLYDLLYTYVRHVELIKDYSSYLNQIICA